MFSCKGDLSAEDPVHGLVHSSHAEPLSQSAAVVFGLHALWGRNARTVEACRGDQSSGGLKWKWFISNVLLLILSWFSFTTFISSFFFFLQIEQNSFVGFSAIAIAVLCSGFAGRRKCFDSVEPFCQIIIIYIPVPIPALEMPLTRPKMSDWESEFIHSVLAEMQVHVWGRKQLYSSMSPSRIQRRKILTCH